MHTNKHVACQFEIRPSGCVKTRRQGAGETGR